MDGITNSLDMGLSKLWEMVKDRDDSEAEEGKGTILRKISFYKLRT